MTTTPISVFPCTDGALAFALAASLALIGLLAVLTISVAIEQGVDVLVVLSLIILALLGIGVFGALRPRPPMTSAGPPPVHRAECSRGARRPRRGGRLVALLVIAAAALAVGAVLYLDLDLDRDDGPGAARRCRSPRERRPCGAGSPKREPDPLVPAEPVPDVPLTGTDSFQ